MSRSADFRTPKIRQGIYVSSCFGARPRAHHLQGFLQTFELRPPHPPSTHNFRMRSFFLGVESRNQLIFHSGKGLIMTVSFTMSVSGLEMNRSREVRSRYFVLSILRKTLLFLIWSVLLLLFYCMALYFAVCPLNKQERTSSCTQCSDEPRQCVCVCVYTHWWQLCHSQE